MTQIASSRSCYKRAAGLGQVMVRSLMVVGCFLSSESSGNSSDWAEIGGVEMDLEERRRQNRIKQRKHYQQVKERRKGCEQKLGYLQSEIEQLHRLVQKYEENIVFLQDRDCPFHTPGDVFDHEHPVFKFCVERGDKENKETAMLNESPMTPESKKRDKQRRFRQKVDNLEREIQQSHKHVKELKDYLKTTYEKSLFYQKMRSECWKGCNKIELSALKNVWEEISAAQPEPYVDVFQPELEPTYFSPFGEFGLSSL